MKLSGLFAKYLYQHKELNLPGIGAFTIDPAVGVPELNDKNYLDFLQNIRFTQKPVLRPDEEFIDYIRVQTGKIRPLAESDLESFISDGKILLNIGKPFYFEGIGSLQKNRVGKYEFIPGLPLVDRLAPSSAERPQQVAEVDRRITREDYDHREASNGSRKGLLGVAIVVGLVAVVWGGYALYNKNTGSGTGEIESQSQPATSDALLTDTSTSTPLNQTPAGAAAVAEPVPGTTASAVGNYKFIIETTRSKVRAAKRYNQLKSYLLDIRMDVPPDSSYFKLYFTIPAAPSDTTRIKDSLKRMYNTKQIVLERS